ncbi:hypothetical protein BHE74_00047195 [Ensete ventricosum]|nr:hypothetical protein GW17_00014075 [Ensete ventricosum]RWW46859.1 hypothetical protein BHE74_00047195 [Ensete ventricosum]RZS17140.1 hypothetical protein BHM03_00049259 [Ensete ventricosum]
MPIPTPPGVRRGSTLRRWPKGRATADGEKTRPSTTRMGQRCSMGYRIESGTEITHLLFLVGAPPVVQSAKTVPPVLHGANNPRRGHSQDVGGVAEARLPRRNPGNT